MSASPVSKLRRLAFAAGRLGAALACAGLAAAAQAEPALIGNPAADKGDELAYALAADQDRLLAGTPGETTGMGAAYLFDCAGAACAPPLRIRPNDLTGHDRFGAAVALSGDTLAIGAFAQASGAVYVFVRSGAGWTQQAKLLAPASAEHFGVSVALDTDRLAIGADQADAGKGAVYVFERNAGTWTQRARLVAGDAAGGDALGRSLALQGDSLLAGAPFKAGAAAGSFARGAAYVFVHGSSTWSQQAELGAADAADGDLFAQSVALAGDTALIGAPSARASAGNAYVFTRSGNTWTQRARLVPAANAAQDSFAWSVALQGDRAVIGAPYVQSAHGLAYVFRGADAAWSETGEAAISTPVDGGLIGWSVAASGSQFFVGAPGYAGLNLHCGAVYAFDADAIFGDGFDSVFAPAACKGAWAP